MQSRQRSEARAGRAKDNGGASGLAYTGERVIPGMVPPMLYNEHAARYAFAAPMARGARVLDLGCGAGYGSHILYNAGARSVLGVDISEEAVEYARGRYGAGGLEFAVMDARRLEAGRSFDLVVAFEVLEHVADHGTLLDSAKAALKRRGRLVISTPNLDENPPGYANPYHHKELDEGEFGALLDGRFRHVHMFRQSHVFGTVIDGQGARVSRALQPHPPRPKYMIAVCSDSARGPPEGAVFPTAFEHSQYLAQASGDSDAGALNALVDEKRFDEAYEFAVLRAEFHGKDARWAYLHAFAAHMTGRRAEAVPLYDRAERLGFDPYWVRYNRGQARLSLGQAGGREDLEAVLETDPSNEEVRKLLEGPEQG